MQSSTHLWVEEGEGVRGPVAQVALLTPVDRLYSYAVPEALAGALRPGQRVEVPFGKTNRIVVGFCVAVADGQWTSTLKCVKTVLDPLPLLDEKLLALGQWMADYYAGSVGLTLGAMVPESVRRGAGMRTVREVSLAAPLETITGAPAGSSPTRLGPKHHALLEHLSREGAPVPLRDVTAAVGCTAAVVRTAEARGHVRITVRREPMPGPDFDRPRDEPTFALNADQSAAVDRLAKIVDDDAFRVVLLFGVSGSGKTEVYVHTMRRVLGAGRQVILLVPEIALTAQTVLRLSARFERVAVIHSGLTAVQRARTWTDIALGRKRVIIGTRSAVFAPCPNLGLIVVDEEQEPTYKSPRTPRYHTRDTAVMRGSLEGFPVILGSATPALETWHNCARLPHYECIRLPRRVAGLPLPHVELIDMCVEQRARRGFHLLSRRMEDELAATLERGEQAVLLLNRRGYASYVFCPSCREPIRCPKCDSNMVLHKAWAQGGRGRAESCTCHYCNTRVPIPDKCPDSSCGRKLVRFGMGTQRVEEELAARFPKLRVARVDSDTMTRPGDYKRIVEDFEARRIDALVGTQMIAKGLDFPFVSFVGVIRSDTALAVPDFRAAERTFQLVVQVAGRSGRAETAGNVIVQTLNLDSDALQAAVNHDYEQFAAGELLTRRRTGLPPYTRLARVVLADPHRTRAREEAVALAQRLRKMVATWNQGVNCIGPQQCPLSRIRNLYRFDLLIRAPSAGALQEGLRRLRAEKTLTAKVRQLTIDVDPVSLL